MHVQKKNSPKPTRQDFPIIGIGFDKQFENKIFTIFQRLHNNEVYTGTGIGLSIGKKIVENHKGLIFSKAEENVGAAFHIILPV